MYANLKNSIKVKVSDYMSNIFVQHNGSLYLQVTLKFNMSTVCKQEVGKPSQNAEIIMTEGLMDWKGRWISNRYLECWLTDRYSRWSSRGIVR